jgi:hypothetical protein
MSWRNRAFIVLSDKNNLNEIEISVGCVFDITFSKSDGIQQQMIE